MADEEYLDAGRPRRRRVPTWTLAGVALVLVGTGAVLADRTDDRPAPPPTSSSSHAVSPALPDDPAHLLVRIVFDRASGPASSHEQVRADHTCLPVPSGVSPVDAADSVIASVVPGFSALDAARTRDAAGLCSLQVRAIDAHDTVLVLVVVAPVPDAYVVDNRIDRSSYPTGDELTQAVRVTTRDGWSVLAGTVGPPRYAPDRARLRALAGRRSLRW